jgi:putative transcriptional regulator
MLSIKKEQNYEKPHTTLMNNQNEPPGNGFSKLKPSAGKILISEPFMNDFFFGRSVVLLAEHNHEGSVGVVINKPLKYRVKDILDDLIDYDDFLYLGGPVNKEHLLYVHTLGDSVPGSVDLTGGFWWGGDLQRIKHLITARVANPNNLRFFSGYSGWSSGQLEGELKRRSWLISNSNTQVILDSRADRIWRNSVLQAGKRFSSWVNFPLSPELN